MTREPCDICGGRQTIRLPVQRRLRAVDFRAEAAVIESPVESSREFPCPQCAKRTPEVRVAVVYAESTMDERMADEPALWRYVQESHGHQMVETLIQSGYIKTVRLEGEKGSHWPKVRVRSRIGVVAQSDVASIESRALEKALAMNAGLVAEMQERVRNWGSHYGTAVIGKGDAMRMIADAAKSVAERQRKEVV